MSGCGDDSAEIPDGVHPFDGTDVDLPRDDLAPLWDLVGDARIIGLGETVHTSGGFYAAKHRLLRVLIEDHGVRTLALEGPRTPARELDEYLVSGRCDLPADEVLLPIPKVFSDDNTYALMRWICERNAAEPSDPVRLFGFDRQGHLDHEEIEAFLTAWAGEDGAGLLAALDPCYVFDDPLPTEAELPSCLEGIDALESWIGAREAELVSSAGERAVRLVEVAAISFRAWQGYTVFGEVDPDRSWEARDVGMAEVFEAMVALEVPPGGRVAVWAANIHLSMNHDRITGTYAGRGARSFGTVVAEAFGSDYAPVALTGYAVGMNWPEFGLDGKTDVGTATGSVESRLHAIREPALIVDPRAEFLDPEVEQVLSEEFMVPGEQFSAIVYLDDSPPMNAVYW
jgi:erythromycin esterase